MIQAPIQKDAPESASVETWAWGVNDQWEPKRSSDISKPYHYWWLKNGTVETLAYELSLIHICTPMEASYDAGLLNGVMVLSGTAKEIDRNGKIKDVPFKAIPYSTWNNRGADQMAVWIPEAAEYARPTPEAVSYTHLFNEMTGFTEKDVRNMMEYYSTTCPFNHSVDELIELIAVLLRNADHQRNA